MSKKALVPVNVLASGTNPTGRYAGDVYFNTQETSVYVYTGSEWISASVSDLDGGAPTSNYVGLNLANGGTP